VQDWKLLCKSLPPRLDPQLKKIISQMYMSVANEMSGKQLFTSPPINQVIGDYKQFMGEKQ
jgi:hypothetical protein